MKLHWLILIAMLAGIALGAILQKTLDAPAHLGASFKDASGGVEIVSISKKLLPKGRSDTERLRAGDVISEIIFNRGVKDKEEKLALASAEDLQKILESKVTGSLATLILKDGSGIRSATLMMDPTSPRAKWLFPFKFLADIFMRLLKMLIVPLVVTSIITGVAGVGGGGDFGRLGTKTFFYYICTSLLAAALGLFLVNVIKPGTNAELGLAVDAVKGDRNENFIEVFQRMVPENVFGSLSQNGSMIQIIFFCILFGFFITRIPTSQRELITSFFQAAFEVMMKMASFVMALVPVGVFCLIVKVVGETGFGVFEPLLWYMLTVFLALVLHSCGTLPILLYVIGRVSPIKWFKAMTPVMLTAFSTSSSSMTLPVTLETVEKRGKISNKITSFVAPLGATVNMDGTALYECIGVIFLAQYYASTGHFDLTLGAQVLVLGTALMASIGAAGIPSAGLVMMLTILSALGLPLEGAALLLAVDRPLDMCRTMVNVWSDTCGTAVLAATEGEKPAGFIPKG